MDWKKIAPWNWFKDEETSAAASRLPERSSPPDPFAALRSEMDRLFEDAFRRRLPRLPGMDERNGALAPLRPSVDISEGRKAYTIRAELPGVEPDDLTIQVEDRTLVIGAEKRRESEEEEEGYHCIERSYGAIQRVLSLPEDADADAIEAKLHHGVLKLRVPRHATRSSSARRIEVQVS